MVGENIYAHRHMGKSFVRAAIDGAYEVMPSVAASVCTTIIAFSPMLFVSGVMGKFIAVMPVAVIAMLVISLFESTTVLPCHLAHERNLFLRVLGVALYPFKPFGELLNRMSRGMERLLNVIIESYYLPSLRWSLHNPAIIVSTALALLIGTYGLIRSGITPWSIMPKLDSRWIEAHISYPDGTPADVTDKATRRLEAAIYQIDKNHGGDVSYGFLVEVR